MDLISSKELKRIALDKLAGHWFVAMFVSFVGALLSGNSTISGMADSISDYAVKFENSWLEITETIPAGVMAIIFALISVAALLGLIAFVIGGAIKLGQCLFYIKLCRDEDVNFGILFSRFNKLLKAFGLNFMMGLFIALWTFLFIIPGIVAAYRYAMAPYIMADNPDIGVFEAINASKKMMKGYKADLFMLHFSFIGWAILCIFTMGLGFIVLSPYISASEAAFYLHRFGVAKPELESEPEIRLQ